MGCKQENRQAPMDMANADHAGADSLPCLLSSLSPSVRILLAENSTTFDIV